MSEVFWMAITAAASWALVIVTMIYIGKQIKAGKEDLKVRLQITFEEKFDSPPLKNARKRLARQILNSVAHDEIQETVMEFYETVGTLYRKGYFDPEMAYSAWSFYCIRWWSATKDYINEERRLQDNDNTLFDQFQYLVEQFYACEIKDRQVTRNQIEPNRDNLRRFLEQEANLV